MSIGAELEQAIKKNSLGIKDLTLRIGRARIQAGQPCNIVTQAVPLLGSRGQFFRKQYPCHDADHGGGPEP